MPDTRSLNIDGRARQGGRPESPRSGPAAVSVRRRGIPSAARPAPPPRRQPPSLWRPALLLLAPLLVRAIAWLELRGDPFFRLLVVDARSYHDTAVQLAGGLFRADLPFWQPPLYPHLLGVLYAIGGPNPDLARWLQIVLGSLSCVLLFRLGSRFFGRTAGWTAWGIAALYAPLIYFDLQILNATIGLFLMLLAFERVTAPGASRRKGAALGGLALGLAGITVASLLIVTPVLGLAIFHSERRVSRDSGAQGRVRPRATPLPAWLIFLAGCSLPVLGITAWNWAGSGEAVVISYNGGVNFWIGNNPDYDTTVALRPGRAWKELMQRPVNAGVIRLGETSSWWYRESWRWIREDPLEWGSLLLKKTRLLLRGDEIYRNQEIYPFRERSRVLRSLLWVFGPAFPFGFLLPLAGAGAVLLAVGGGKGGANRQQNLTDMSPSPADPWGTGSGARAVFLLLALIASLGLSVVAFFVTARYRLPMVPLLILLAAGGCAHAPALLRRSRHGLAKAVAALVLLALLLASNTGLPAMPRSFNSDTYFDMGTEFFMNGDLQRAMVQYHRALSLNPRNAEAAHNLGGVLLRMGRLEEAEECFRMVLKMHHGDLHALQNLAAVAFHSGDLYKAGWFYTQAAGLHPGSDEVRRDLEGLSGELRRRETARFTADPAALIDSLRVEALAQPQNEFLLRRIRELTGAE